MKRRIFILGLVISLILSWCSCTNNRKLSKYEQTFFGDSVALFILNNPQNGYHVSIIHNKQLNLIHFERGDSISQYCAIHELPKELREFEEDSIGVFYVDVDFPVLKIDTLGGSKDSLDMFFMDMDFDDEEEFVVKHNGYNRWYYACFDLVKGNTNDLCPGILEPNNEPPYNNIVSGFKYQPAYTVFDYNKKTIYIYETVGCMTLHETWAKYFERNKYGSGGNVKVYKKMNHDFIGGKEYIETYKLINDSLKLVK